MKNSIASEYLAVEPPESPRPSRPPRPAKTAAPKTVADQTVVAPAVAPAAVSQPVAGGGPRPVLFIGLDVHNDSIAVSLAPSDSTEVRRYGRIGGDHDDVLELIKKSSRPLLPASN